MIYPYQNDTLRLKTETFDNRATQLKNQITRLKSKVEDEKRTIAELERQLREESDTLNAADVKAALDGRLKNFNALPPVKLGKFEIGMVLTLDDLRVQSDGTTLDATLRFNVQVQKVR